jgi:hypothetical protein
MKKCYEGIIDYKWEGSPNRIRMPLERRAKIFAAFIPLRGYMELIKKAEEEAYKKFENE